MSKPRRLIRRFLFSSVDIICSLGTLGKSPLEDSLRFILGTQILRGTQVHEVLLYSLISHKSWVPSILTYVYITRIRYTLIYTDFTENEVLTIKFSSVCLLIKLVPIYKRCILSTYQSYTSQEYFIILLTIYEVLFYSTQLYVGLVFYVH